MKSNIHPQWNHQATVTCACGNVFTTGSSQENIQVDICSNCHPFFTGEMRFVDVQGRVDRFKNRQQIAAQRQATKKTKKSDTKATKEENKSLREILQDEKKRLAEAVVS